MNSPIDPTSSASSQVMQMNVTLPVGTTYVLVIDTDTYSGNFEREITGYCTGIVDEDRHHGRSEAQDAQTADPVIAASLRTKAKSVPHDDYGEVTNTIRPTPGRLNDGSGGHYDAAPGETGWPAYESVAIFLNAPLDETEMAFVRRRAQEFAERPSKRLTPFRILDVYQIRSVVAAQEERIG